jgi:ABC-type branched-subunit amino acid transport system ATPase component
MRPSQNGKGVLETVGLSKYFEGVRALQGVSLRLEEGALVGLIGPNGSGKTTLLNCVSGVYPPSGGAVLLDGKPIGGRPAHELAAAGVVRTFQNIRLFGRLTVRENVEVSALAAGAVGRSRSRELARELLREIGLSQLEDRFAATLSYGDQRRLEVARALAARPRFLLLDEPAAGMNEAESDELRRQVARIRKERGCGVLVVEHDLRLIMQLCERIHVLNEGRTISEGTPASVRDDREVIAAYIGEEKDDQQKGVEA